jgi:hypothetical protein
MSEVRYEKFRPLESARLALNYLTGMVDERYDHLPFWLVMPHENPARAKHTRVDDAELVASWYEAIDAVRGMLGTDEGAEVEAGVRRHLMKSWGERGLRFHEDYPWSRTNHSSFHEMAYVLSALNRIVEKDPSDAGAEGRASGLVRGMRSLVVERKVRTFWSGDFPETEPVYEFPNDVYLREGGFDLTRHTGRGEQPIRNGMMLHSLVRRWEIAQDDVALDLARGIANHLLGVSHYFNYRMEFFGHVHSAVWVASGLVRLGRFLGEERYVARGRGIYDYVRSISSSFGWVPEYAQWFAPGEVFCETCCIKDMIQCATELVDAGLDGYWNDIVLFSRNQLVENQVRDGRFVAADDSIPDTEDTTFRGIDRRVVGGWSGGAEPNSISLLKFRSIAGCCVGTAPQALEIVWDRAVEAGPERITANVPVDKETGDYGLAMDYPDAARMALTPKRRSDVAFRLYPWMQGEIGVSVDGRPADHEREGGLAVVKGVPAGSAVELTHDVSTRDVPERVRGADYVVRWRGPDVVDMEPRGEPLRLWQRRADVPKEYPEPVRERTDGAGFVAAPTRQKE